MIIEGLEVTDSDIERLYNKFQLMPDGCWLWTANKTSTRKRGGYGRFWMGDIGILAHRFIYQWLRGPIPEGGQLDHLCRNTLCVNPDHLEVVDNRTNCLRGVGPTAENARKTHCPKGHEYTEENTYSFRGGRTCKACRKVRGREWHRKKYGTTEENFRV